MSDFEESTHLARWCVPVSLYRLFFDREKGMFEQTDSDQNYQMQQQQQQQATVNNAQQPSESRTSGGFLGGILRFVSIDIEKKSIK